MFSLTGCYHCDSTRWGDTVPSLLIRNISPERLEFWKNRAARNGRSLQAEIDRVLAEHEDLEDGRARFRDFVERSRAATAGTRQTDSADLIREDRER